MIQQYNLLYLNRKYLYLIAIEKHEKMNFATNNQSEYSSTNESMKEVVMGLIDSKMQFVKHRTNSILAQKLDDSTFSLLSEKKDGEEDILSQVEKTGHDASILQYIEGYSKTTRMLLFLRNYLDTTNAKIIFDLLTDDIYLNFNEKELKIVIDGRNLVKAE